MLRLYSVYLCARIWLPDNIYNIVYQKFIISFLPYLQAQPTHQTVRELNSQV